jgi:protein PsiE
MEFNPLKKLIRVGEIAGLSVIALATFIAAGSDIYKMVINQSVHLADLLMLFIYLEVLAMVGIYLKSGKLPIRLPIYIAIVAMARYLILEIHAMEWYKILVVSSAIVLLSITALILRFGSTRFPMEIENEYQQDSLVNQRPVRRRNNRNHANQSNRSNNQGQHPSPETSSR